MELVDSLDSGSSVHCGRAGSSPASPTIKTAAFVRRAAVFLISSLLNCPPRNSAPANYLKKSCKVFHGLLYWFSGSMSKEHSRFCGDTAFDLCSIGEGEVLWIWFMKLNEK